MSDYAIIVAGGKGLRMGADLPKQFLPIGGRPVLMHTLEAFERAIPGITLVLVLPHDQQDFWRDLCRQHAFTLPHTIVDGGQTRFHSVLNGLKSLTDPPPTLPAREGVVTCDFGDLNSKSCDADACSEHSTPSLTGRAGGGSFSGANSLVAVHDGVRPFVSVDVIRRCYEAAREHGAAIPVVPVVETVRQLNPPSSTTLDRSLLRLVQTPQVFRLDLLCRAYEQPYRDAFTDDASVVEALGHPITLVEGNRENIKITTPFDLTVAEALCAAR